MEVFGVAEKKEFRQVIRISNAYYVSVPKSAMAAARLFRGSPVQVWLEGTRLQVETDPQKFVSGWGGAR